MNVIRVLTTDLAGHRLSSCLRRRNAATPCAYQRERKMVNDVPRVGCHGRLVRPRYSGPGHWQQAASGGCTFSEGVSWGKFVPPSEGGRFAEVLCDATIAWPILVRGVLERMGRV